ncbi:helicase-associated domain-containing protein [Gordonia sp. ABSL1-1]|uniref:helicase-associated domain-containing protein n=1 Tax=Gordonia sp. ABSL1-1 TaxID=3053923 RepID=UPI002572D22B|nr:helicase-associated domain-containing protein [Gordonia sp. ABSL1-1]MDL9937820.1 helicase-associated domain-containing protein [Gordonia sp. ABSL1-1]
MSPDDLRHRLADDLAARADDELTDLLAHRPDLASPPPQGTAVLAQRALSAASLALVGDDLDLLGVAVLEQVLTPVPKGRRKTPPPVTVDAVVGALADRADADELRSRVDLLRRRAVIWGPDDDLSFGANADAALPWRSKALTGPLAHLDAAEIAALIDGLDERRLELLRTLARGPALGRSRDADPDADPNAPVPQLIAAGLLARVDNQTVELPPMVGALLREEPPLRTDDLRPPPLVDAGGKPRFSARDIDAAAGGEALELIRHMTALLTTLGTAPAAVLRSGALGVRELRRLAKATGLDVKRVGLLAELAGYLRLIDAGFPDPPPPNDTGEQAFTPTTAADTWLHQPRERQWAVLLEAWLAMPRRPWQIGEPDRDGNALATLSGDLHDAYAPVQRRLILDALTAAPTAAAVSAEAVVAALHWQHPRQIRRFGLRVVGETLEEARELGLTAHHAITSVGRAALADDGSDPEAETALLRAIHTALPDPVDHFLTQADLTLTVPGPMTPELADQVEMVADLESGGAASVYRISEESVRRALDAGRSSSELIAMFTAHSRTPVPQSLTYLIEDVARKHGQLRVGIAASFIRCEDPTTLAAVLRSPAAETLALRALAPTVAVSPSEVRDVIDALRAAGFAPAGEDSSGTLVDLRQRGSRVNISRQRRQPTPRRSTPAPAQLANAVSRMRSHDRANAAQPATARTGTTTTTPVRATGGGESATALIQLALRAGRRLRVGYVDAQGSASRHVVSPRILGAGQLIAVEEGSDEEQRFSLHRVTSIDLLDS